MRRVSQYDTTKLISFSSKSAVVSLFVDSFPIEMIKLRVQTYGENSEFIDIYLDFSAFLAIAHDVETGKFFNDLVASPNGVVLSRGGSANSKRLNGQPESRILSVSLSQSKNVFFNAQAGLGKLGQTGLIMPAGEPDKKLSSMMSVAQCKEFFIYGKAAIQAYLVNFIPKLIENGENQRIQNQGQVPQTFQQQPQEQILKPVHFSPLP